MPIDPRTFTMTPLTETEAADFTAHGKTRQAKCRHCKVRYVWRFRRGTPLVRESFCPKCGRRLWFCTHLTPFPVIAIDQPLTFYQSRQVMALNRARENG